VLVKKRKNVIFKYHLNYTTKTKPLPIIMQKTLLLIILFVLCPRIFFAQSSPEIVLPMGHTGIFTQFEVSPDKKYLLTVSADKTTKLWDFLTGRLIYTIERPNINVAHFSKDGKYFFTYGYTNEPITVWDTKTITPVTNIDEPVIKYANLSNDNKTVFVLNGALKINKWETFTSKKIISPISDIAVTDMRFSDDGTMYYYFDYVDSTIVLCNTLTDEVVRTIHAKQNPGYFTLSSKNGFMLLEYDGFLNNKPYTNFIIFNIKANKVESTFQGYFIGKKAEDAIKFSPDEKYLCSTEYVKNKLHMWNVDDGKEVEILTVKDFKDWRRKAKGFTGDEYLEDVDSSNGIDAYFFSPDSKYVCITGWSKTNVIDLASKQRVISSVDAAPQLIFTSNQQVVIPLYQKGVGFYNFPYLQQQQILFNGETEKIDEQYYDSDNKILTITTKHYLQLWNINNESAIFKKCDFFAISPNNKAILVQKADNELYVIDSKTGDDLYKADIGNNSIDPGRVNTAEFSPSGKYIVISSTPNVTVVDAQNGKLVKEISFEHELQPNLRISNDDKYIAVSYGSFNSPETVIYNLQDDKSSVRSISNVYLSFLNAPSNCFLYSVYGSTNRFENIDNVLVAVDFSNDKFKYKKTGKFSYVTNYNNHYLVTTAYDSSKAYMTEYNIKRYPIKIETTDLTTLKKLNEIEENDGPSVFFGTSDAYFFTYYFAGNTDSNANKIIIRNIKSGTQTGVINLGFSPINGRIFSDKSDNFLAFLTDDNTVYIYSLKTFNLIRKIAIHKEITHVEFTNNTNQLIVTVGGLTELILFDPLLSAEQNNSLTVASFAQIGMGQFMQVNNNYYSIDKDLLRDVSFRYNGNNFSAEQLDIKYNRPDKVMQQMGNSDTALISSYRKAYEKRIKKLGIDTTQFYDGSNMPECDFANRDTINYNQSSQWLKLHISGTAQNSAISRFNIWINETPLYGVRGINMSKARNQVIDTVITVLLSQGENRIETSITNARGAESYRAPLFVKYTPTDADSLAGKLHFIGIGINQFADSLYNLSWSVKDIRDLALNLKNKYSASGDISIDTLFNRDVITKNIVALKQKLLQTGVNDKVIIAYSGHGLLSKDYDYYLSTFNIDFDKPELKGLPYDVLQDLLDSIPARKKLLLIDACNSGEVDKEEMQYYQQVQTTLDSTKKGIIKLTPKSQNILGTKSSFALMQQLFVNAGKSTGATIISAAAGTQFALERNNLQNGVFTYSILEYMQRHRTASVAALKKYVNERVSQLTNGAQVPTERSENTKDWMVW